MIEPKKMTVEEIEEFLCNIKYDENDDSVRIKQLIKENICHDPMIIHVLENPDLDEDTPDDYFGVNIFDYIRVPNTQSKVKNFVTYAVNIEEDIRNDKMKVAYITFGIFCNEDSCDTKYGIARHDLLGYLIRKKFNWSNIFGTQVHLVYDKESVLDIDYSCHTLKFEFVVTNGITDINGKVIQ